MAIGNEWIFALTLASVIGSGLIAGVFFTFSTFVMKALSRLPAAEGIAAMQAINITVINPLFIGVFVGTALSSVLLIISVMLRWQENTAVYLLGGSLVYLIGTFLVTVIGNVPKNEALAVVTPTAPASAALWQSYLVKWTAWNHLRTLGALVAMVLLVLALCN